MDKRSIQSQSSAQSPHYQSYIDQFNIDELENTILQGSRIHGINAYVECVGRHAHSANANKVALVHEEDRKSTRLNSSHT